MRSQESENTRQITSIEINPHTVGIRTTIDVINYQINRGDRIVRIIGKDVFTLSPENMEKLKNNSSRRTAQLFKKFFVSKLLQSDIVIFSSSHAM